MSIRLHRQRRRALVAAALLVAVAALAATAAVATSGASTRQRPTRATLVLDFIPNAVHAGIYRAIAAGYYRRAGIDLRVIQPTSTADTLRLIDAGKADFGIADGIDVANQIDLGRDAKAIMALTERPLSGPIALAKEHLRTAKDLEGKTVGLTGVPSDTAVLTTVVEHAGGDPKKVRTVVIGFNGVQALENGRVAAFTGFWPADGVQLQVDGFPIKVFKLDENGGPDYPGLVVFSTQKRIQHEPALIRGFVGATVHGYLDTLKNPTRSLDELLAQNPAIKRTFAAASLRAYLPLFKANEPRYGVLRTAKLRELSAWLVEYKLIARPISPARYGTNAFLPKE